MSTGNLPYVDILSIWSYDFIRGVYVELVDSEDMFPKNDALYRMGLVISILFPFSLFRCQHSDKQMHEKEKKNQTY